MVTEVSGLQKVGVTSVDDTVLQQISQMSSYPGFLEAIVVGHKGKQYFVAVYSGQSNTSDMYAIVGNGIPNERREIEFQSPRQLRAIIDSIKIWGYTQAILDGDLRAYEDVKIKPLTERQPQ